MLSDGTFAISLRPESTHSRVSRSSVEIRTTAAGNPRVSVPFTRVQRWARVLAILSGSLAFILIHVVSSPRRVVLSHFYHYFGACPCGQLHAMVAVGFPRPGKQRDDRVGFIPRHFPYRLLKAGFHHIHVTVLAVTYGRTNLPLT